MTKEELSIKVDSFVKEYTGKFVDTDGYYGAQCMDLMHKYVEKVLGVSDPSVLRADTANLAYITFNRKDLFDKIDNTLLGMPEKGDIVFFGTKVGSAGHVAIYLDGGLMNFKTFDQNWPTGNFCSIQSHSYLPLGSVLGWLRFKFPVDPCADLKKQLEYMTKKADDLDKELKGVKSERDVALKKISKAKEVLS